MYWTIQKNTFRINLTFPTLAVGDIPEGTGILTGMYEWSQKRKFSLVSKIGIRANDINKDIRIETGYLIQSQKNSTRGQLQLVLYNNLSF